MCLFHDIIYIILSEIRFDRGHHQLLPCAGGDLVLVVDFTVVRDFDLELSRPPRCEGAEALVGVVGVGVDEVAVLVVDVEVEVGVTIAGYIYPGFLSAGESDSVDVGGMGSHTVGVCVVASYALHLGALGLCSGELRGGWRYCGNSEGEQHCGYQTEES